jgi:two-component system LytT family response regulator
MITAIIVDDEPYCCETLSILLAKYCPEVKVISICYSGEAALKDIIALQPQLVFLDVEMPNMNGFQLLEQLNDINFDLVFTTSYDQYAIKAIHFSALDYLLKPIDSEELRNAIQKVLQQSHRLRTQQLEILLDKLNQPAASVKRIAMPTMEGLRLLPIDSIISCASESNYTTFHLKNNQKLVVSKTLKEVAEMLQDHSFFRVHNSAVVNLNEIIKYGKGEGGYLVMSDGSTVDVARSRKEMLLQKIHPPK